MKNIGTKKEKSQFKVEKWKIGNKKMFSLQILFYDLFHRNSQQEEV